MNGALRARPALLPVVCLPFHKVANNRVTTIYHWYRYSIGVAVAHPAYALYSWTLESSLAGQNRPSMLRFCMWLAVKGSQRL
jgi:hypothetical protein